MSDRRDSDMATTLLTVFRSIWLDRGAQQIATDDQAGAFVSLLGQSGVREINAIADVRQLRSAGPAALFQLADELWTIWLRERATRQWFFRAMSLYPHMTVEENISLAPVMESLSAVQRLPMVGPFVSGGEPR